MESGPVEPPVIELDGSLTGRATAGGPVPPRARSSGGSGTRTLAIIALLIAVLAGVFAAGRAAGRPAERARAEAPQPAAVPAAAPTAAAPTADVVPAAPAEAESDPTDEAQPPRFTDLLGEGSVLAELDLGNRSSAVLWCRESVPGTTIGSTLTLFHVADSLRFGPQVIRTDEMTRPWVPLATGRRGIVLETEGLGVGSARLAEDVDGDDDTGLDPASIAGATDGSRCESCAPERAVLDGAEVLAGSCVHGVPFGAGIAYVLAAPTQPGQGPLALLADCGITRIRIDGDGVVIEADAPLVRGLHDAVFPLPAMSFERSLGWFVADDLELFDWNCDVDRSTQLADRHLLRTEPVRRITTTPVESAIGIIGVHGPMVVGQTAEQCSRLTRAWWGRPDLESRGGSPIADLLELDPPDGEQDWFYTCQLP